MTSQLDMFGQDETAVRSFPPYLDPNRATDWEIIRDEDTDHVAGAVNGVLPVGAVGNNAEVWLAQVLDKDDNILASFPCSTWRQARTKLDECVRLTLENGQRTLF